MDIARTGAAFARARFCLVGLLLLAWPVLPAGAAELADMRERALALVNEARAGEGLDALELTGPLNEAAQSHADDMLARDYYSHTSPEGGTVKDRFRDAGGSRWKLAAENIATCAGCATPPGMERVTAFQQGWMDSPGHRRNILTEGLAGFGFGIAGRNGRVYAVQTFSGPGTPRGLGPDEEPVALGEAEQTEKAVAVANKERERKEIAPLEASDALSTAARKLLPEGGDTSGLIEQPDDLFALLPEGAAGEWRRLSVLAAACGGCGTKPTAADIRYFVEQWSGDPQDGRSVLGEAMTAMGFAMRTDGAGRKTAVAVLGEGR